jgi:hypothetical protein
MTMFVVERRMLNVSTVDLAMLQEALSFACDRLTSRGEPVRCVGSTFLPGPARLLTLFEAESAEAVRKVNENVHAPFFSLEAALKIALAPDAHSV